MSPGRGREGSGIYSTSKGVMKDALAPSVSSSRVELGPDTSPSPSYDA